MVGGYGCRWWLWKYGCVVGGWLSTGNDSSTRSRSSCSSSGGGTVCKFELVEI